jgi:hypothetical protein
MDDMPVEPKVRLERRFRRMGLWATFVESCTTLTREDEVEEGAELFERLRISRQRSSMKISGTTGDEGGGGVERRPEEKKAE